MDFGTALSKSFPLSSYIPQANIAAVNVGSFHPEATMYRNRYGVLRTEVKGWPPDHIQHGQSTFWLSDLFRHPAFLAEHPEFSGVTVAEPPSMQDMTDLQFAASGLRGGAYAYLQDRADQLGLLGSAAGTGPASSPGAPGVPGTPSPAPAPLPPPPPAPAPLPVPLAPQQPGQAGFLDLTLRHAIEARFPGKGDAYANALSDLDGLGAHPDPGKLIADLLPLFGGSLGVYGPAVGMLITLALSAKTS